MSYKGDDKWECYIPKINVRSNNFKDFKEKILEKLQEGSISQAVTQIKDIGYKITDLTIKRENNNEIK